MRADKLPNSLYARLADFIAAKIGLSFPPERRADLERCLVEAAPEFGFANAPQCAHWLLSTPLSPSQLNALATHLTIGETYFFRERKVIAALAEHVLPELIERRRGRHQYLRLWSAACSTGEEPYSLAILLHELLPDWCDWQVTLLATDINTRSLQKAAAATYGEWSFRESAPGLKERYFTRTAEQRFAVIPQIQRRVKFAQMNLADDFGAAADIRAMDVILCRNLLIYFAPAQALRLVENLRGALSDGGWLVVSPSECSQTLFARFTAVNFPGAILYRKDRAAEAATVITPGAEFSVPPEWVIQESELTQPPREPSAGEPAPPLEPESVPCANPEELSRAFANEGKLPEALTWSARWVAADKLNPRAHYLHAMILMELGEWSAARGSLQRAVYLQPDFVLAHFALGNCARGDARGTEASRHLANALRLARARPANEELPESDGLTAGRLTEMITALAPNDGLRG